MKGARDLGIALALASLAFVAGRMTVGGDDGAPRAPRSSVVSEGPRPTGCSASVVAPGGAGPGKEELRELLREVLREERAEQAPAGRAPEAEVAAPAPADPAVVEDAHRRVAEIVARRRYEAADAATMRAIIATVGSDDRDALLSELFGAINSGALELMVSGPLF